MSILPELRGTAVYQWYRLHACNVTKNRCYVLRCYQGCHISISTFFDESKCPFTGSIGEHIEPRHPYLHFTNHEPRRKTVARERHLSSSFPHQPTSFLSVGPTKLQQKGWKSVQGSHMGFCSRLRLHLQFWQSVNKTDYILEGQNSLKKGLIFV